MRLVFDIECDGLREDATKIWCIVALDIDTEELYFYTPDEIEQGLTLLQEAKQLIGHNIISYDLPVIKKLHGVELNANLFDTLVVSRVLNPDRTGGHSIEAWGRQLGLSKPVHEDWSIFSEAMLHRCKEDVRINFEVFKALVTEMQNY